MHTIKRNVVSGILILVPVVITIYVLGRVFVFCDTIIGPYVFKALHFTGKKLEIGFLERVDIPGAGVVFLFLIIYLTGFFAHKSAGKWCATALKKYFSLVPGVNRIYTFATRLARAFDLERKSAFQKVVLVEVEKGAYTLGLITGPVEKRLYEQDAMLVYAPGSPNPLTGSLLVVNKDRIINTTITVHEALEKLLSGGMIAEDSEEAQ